MKYYIVSTMAFIFMCAVVYADDPKLGRDDFVSSSVADIFDKLNQYTSGEKSIFIEDENVRPQGMDYEMDALGNKIPDKVVDAEESAASGSPLVAKKKKQ